MSDAIAKVVSGYSGDPDTKDSKRVDVVGDLSNLPIGTVLVALPAGSVVLSAKEYDDLSERDRWLSALEGAGVDNWDGWDEARDMLAEWDAEGA